MLPFPQKPGHTPANFASPEKNSDGRRGIRRSGSGAGASSKGPTDPMGGALADAGSAGTVFPFSIAMATPQTFTMTSQPALFTDDGVVPTCVGTCAAPGPHPPGWSR